MADRRSRLWRSFVLGRTLVAAALIVLLLILNGLPPERGVWPLLGLALLQLAAHGLYALAGRLSDQVVLGWLASGGEILLISLLIWLLGQDGWTFLLAYCWPIIVGGLIVGRRAIPGLTLWTGLCVIVLLTVQRLGWAPEVRLLAPDGTPQALVLAYPYLVFVALLIWLVVRELEISRGELDLRNAELLRERNLLSGTLAHMREAVVLTDETSCMVQANPAAREMLHAEEGQPTPAWLIGPHGRPSNGAQRLVQHEGRTLRIGASLLPAGGELCGATLYVASDVTEETELEQLKADFVSYASHELRTPLTTIRTLVRLLQRDAAPGSRESQYLSIIESQVARQAHLATTLLDYARLEAGGYELSLEPVDAPRVIEEALVAFRSLAAEKELTLEVRCAEGMRPFLWNADALEQVLANLVTNAIAFTDPGGLVTVSLHREAGDVLLEVADTGIGMSPSEVVQAFRRFYTTRRQLGRGEGGGLGLVICRMIAEALGGSISVESHSGAGTRFTVRLPAREAAEQVDDLPADADKRICA